jgi:exoribonuclease II
MLNNSALQQLAQLKTTLVAQKEIKQGSVRSTTKRFGFVVLDDGREAFLDPDQMQRVLPEDRVEIEVATNSKGQLEAKLEKLLDSPLKEFVGRYVSKGTNFFVEPDLLNFNRWLFVPPQDRKGLAENDYVHCTVIRHPFSDGKAQVRVVTRLGKADEPGIENRYTVAKYQLPQEWSAPAQNQASGINWSPLVFENGEWDLTQLPFVTIDSENTRDMDDAIYISANADGWELITAIADPSKQIDIGSPLELAARERASTVYLLGQSITMLPADLSHDTYSLIPDKRRPALVCRVQIARDGSIGNFEFAEAQIRSQQKLNYQAVADHLNGEKSLQDAGFNISEDIQQMLLTLQEFARARADYRQQHALVMDEKPDYFFILNDQKKIDHVDKRERNIAHRMIEEAMLVTNICAGELFLQHPGYGIFSTHIGFRAERLNDAISLINEDRPDLIEKGLVAADLAQLDKFQQLFKELRANPNAVNTPLLSLLQRMLQAGSLSFEPIPHFGLGFKAYAMVTSPIRRYNDFFNHLAIKRILRDEPPIELEQEALAMQLQEQLNLGRQACRYLELWLQCQFMVPRIDTLHSATIGLVNGNGIGVRLDDLGIEGYALLVPKEKEPKEKDRENEVKAQFDSRRLSLTANGKTYRLDEKVHVLVKEVDVAKRKIAVEVVDEATAARLSAWL